MKIKYLLTCLLLGLLVLSCGKDKKIHKGPEPKDYEPDSQVENVPFEEAVPAKDKDDYQKFIEDLGGTYRDPSKYEMSFDGLDEYLSDSQISHFTAEEIGIARTSEAARQCGLTHLIPPKGNWVKAAAILLIFEDVRKRIDSKIWVTSWFRPKCYNAQVGGATNSDHISADAMDVVYESESIFKLAQKYLCEFYWRPREGSLVYAWNPLNLSIGLGGTMMHLGLFSNKGRRYWYYPTYVDDDSSGGCW